MRTKSPDDWTTTVKPDGTTEYLSPSGDRVLRKPDGTLIESGPDQPTVTTHPDQTKQIADHDGRVTVVDPQGNRYVAFDSADIQGAGRSSHTDGTEIRSDLKGTLDIGTGDRLRGLAQDGPRKPALVQMERPDGIGLESSPKGVKVFDDDGTVYEADSRGSMRVTMPNGQISVRSTTEPIELSNGAQLERTSGGFRVVHGDESVSEIGSRGATFTDGEGVVRGTRSDGTTFVRETDGTLREI
ncbi:hypothetical protein ACW9HQ_41730, partial [Nocardia gipuzkoensis]